MQNKTKKCQAHVQKMHKVLCVFKKQTTFCMTLSMKYFHSLFGGMGFLFGKSGQEMDGYFIWWLVFFFQKRINSPLLVFFPKITFDYNFQPLQQQASLFIPLSHITLSVSHRFTSP